MSILLKERNAEVWINRFLISKYKLDSVFLFNIFSGISLHPADFPAIISLAISILLLYCSALIGSAEVAFFSLTPADLNELEESDNKKDKKILALLKQPQHLLATILIGNNFVNVAIILLLTNFTTTILSFDQAPMLGFVFHTIVITFILLLIAEIMPKIYATQYGRKAAESTVNFIVVLQKIFKPFAKFLVNSTSIVNNRLKKKKSNRANISFNELSEALELTSKKSDEDTEILAGIIKFGNIRVSDIMTPRIDIQDVDVRMNFKDLLAFIAETGYSRVPVYSGNRDNNRGMLYSKDLLPHLDKPANFRWQSLIRQAYYVPETKKIDDLLSEFQENKVHVALVIDEYGGASGLITLEDILEEIVGDIADEYDVDERQYTKIDSQNFVFEAKMLLNDFYKIDEITKDDFAKITDEVETLAGLILELVGEIPQKGQKVIFGKYEFEVVSVDDRRIIEVKLFINDEKKK